MRVLVVEDELLIAMDIESAIVVAGHECVGIVSSGRAALETLAATPTDVVLLDLQLSDGASGLETGREIRDEFGSAVVFLTANATDPKWRGRLEEVSGDHPLPKPCTADQIVAALERAVARQAAAVPDVRPVRGPADAPDWDAISNA